MRASLAVPNRVLSTVNRLKDQGDQEHSDRDLCHTVDLVRLDHVK